jgi:hypothetical protein
VSVEIVFGHIEVVYFPYDTWTSITLHYQHFYYPPNLSSSFTLFSSIIHNHAVLFLVTCQPATAIQAPISTHPPTMTDTYGHRIKKARVPVRSLTDKLDIGGLVVGWVTTSESPLLYVFVIFW